MKIYKTTSASLYPQPGRTVTTFPSGLILVDQNYICADSDAAASRSTLAVGNPMPDGDSSPSIEGLAIFPAPQENRRGDGFTEFTVSAYGRSTTTLQTINLTPLTLKFGYFFNFKLRSISGSIAIQAGTVLEYDDLALNPDWLDPFDFTSVSPSLVVLDANIIEEYSKGDLVEYNGHTYLADRSYKVWRVSLTGYGQTPSRVFDFRIYAPTIAVKSYRHFGQFVEMDLETTTLWNNVSTDIIP
jgi:hypothetical protein